VWDEEVRSVQEVAEAARRARLARNLLLRLALGERLLRRRLSRRRHDPSRPSRVDRLYTRPGRLRG